MKSTNYISLKNSYKYLQAKMWELNSQTNQLNKQNVNLKSKINVQRILSSNKKSQTSYTKKLQLNQETADVMIKRNFQHEYKNNQMLKQQIYRLEQQKKEINKNLQLMRLYNRKNQILYKKLKRYKQKLNKFQKNDNFANNFPIDRYEKQQKNIQQKVYIALKEEQHIANLIKQAEREIQQQKRCQKKLSSQILQLIQYKNKLKIQLKRKHQKELLSCKLIKK